MFGSSRTSQRSFPVEQISVIPQLIVQLCIRVLKRSPERTLQGEKQPDQPRRSRDRCTLAADTSSHIRSSSSSCSRTWSRRTQSTPGSTSLYVLESVFPVAPGCSHFREPYGKLDMSVPRVIKGISIVSEIRIGKWYNHNRICAIITNLTVVDRDKIGLRLAMATLNLKWICVIVSFALWDLRVKSCDVQLLAFCG